MFIDNSQTNLNPLLSTPNSNAIVPVNQAEDLLIGGRREIAFIDSQLDNYQTLIQGLEREIKVVVLDNSSEQINQITQILSYQNYGLDAIHIFSHGAVGSIQLGNTVLNQGNLGSYQSSLTTWGQSLKQGGDLLFYGCNIGAGTTGQDFLEDLSEITGGDVAASNDLTGNTDLGGDWTLEIHTGDISSLLPLQASALQAYKSILPIFSGTQNLSTATYNDNIIIQGDTTLNVTGDLTLSNLGKILGDGVGALDNLTIKASGNVILGGLVGGGGLNNITIEAKSISILDGVQITTSGDISFEAKNNSSALLNLLPGGVVNIQEAKITLGNNVFLQAGDISLTAEALDENSTDDINEFVNGFIVQPLLDYAAAIASLPVSVVLRDSSASVTLGNNAKLTSSGDIEISATSKADSTSKVLNKYFSIGYSAANASAIATIGQGAIIQAEGDINILSDANAVAKITTRTLQNLGESSSDTGGIAVSLAIANATLTSKTTVSQGALIEAGGNANIVANGKTEREASAEAGAFADGKAGLSAALGFSKADVHTFVDGQIQSGSTLEHEFNPASAVNNDDDTITIANHGFKNGQAVIYKNNNDADSNIGELEDGTTYYVMVVDDNTIKLAESLSDLEEEKAIDLEASGVEGDAHILKDPGIRVIAQLESEDAADATSGAGGEPAIADNITKPEVALSPLIDALTKDNYGQNSNSGGSGANSSISGAGAFAFSKINNNVTATVGSNAILQSQSDISVQASISENLKTAAEAATEPDPNNEQAKKDSASAAVIVGLYSNNAQATIESSAATDAKKDTRITSEVSYPFRTTLKEHFNIGEKLKEDGLTGLTDYLDGKLGLQGSLFNSWAISATKTQGDIGLAGTVNYQQFTNNSQAIIKSGAQINQNVAFQTDAQTVSVEAATEMELINVTGVFKFDLSIDSLKDLVQKKDPLAIYNPVGSSGGKGGVGGAFFLMFNDSTTIAKVQTGAFIHTGSDGGLTINAESKATDFNFAQAGGGGSKFGIAGTFSYTNQESKTIAHLESGAIVTGGSLEITANDETTRITAVGGIAKSENLGIGLSVTINDMNRETAALIGNQTGAAGIGTSIDVGDIKVAAKADGGLWAFSLAAAVVTEKPPEKPSAASTDPAADLASGSTSGGGSSGSTSGAESNTTSNDQGNQGRSGVGISGDVSINTVTDKVLAYINDAGTIEAEKVIITAENDSAMRTASGSVAFATSDPNKTSAGIAGSFSMNTLTGTTSAYISGRAADGQKLSLTANELSLSATRAGDLFALSAGGSAAPGQNGYAVSGSVSLNNIANTTEAFINNTQATIDGDISLNAKDTSKIFAIAGAASYGGKAGFGAAIAINNISGNTRASLDNSTLDYTGKLEIAATSENDIQAISASVGLSLGQESTLGGAGTVSVNKINSQIQASISNTQKGSTNPTGLLSVIAKDKSSIQSFAGAVGVSRKIGFGAAVAYNRISGDTKAFISQSDLSTQSDVSIQAETDRTIQSLSLGVGGGKNLGLAGSVSINKIGGSTAALIDNNSNITVQGKIDLSATVSGSIGVISGGIAGSVATGGNAPSGSGAAGGDAGNSSALSGSGAASIAINSVKNSIIAAIANSSTIKLGGQNTLSISAKDNSAINALSLGGALAVATGSGTSGTLAVGVSAAKNEINNTTAAYIDDSTVSSSNDTDVNLDLQALSTNTISAQSIAIAISVAKGSTGIALSGGGAGSGNYILTKTNAYVKDSNLDHIGNVAIKANNTSNIDATVVAVSGSVAIGDSTGAAAAIGAAVANNFIGYEEDSDRNPSEVQAYIQNSSVQASGDLILNALANENIIARVGAGSVAVAASSGSTGMSGSGSGVVTLNKIATLVKAFVDGDGVTGIQAKSATLTATDSSKIKADAGAASIAVAAASTTGGSLSIGVSVASNLISNEVEAFINNADTSFETTTGGISLSATTNPIIEAVSVAASIAVGAAGTTGVGISGAGAAAINTILTKTNAYIKDSVVTSAGAVTLAATNTATIDAKIAAVSVAVGGGGTTGVGVSIGMAVANNFIGYDDSNRQPIEVQAYIQNSSLETNQDLKLTALSGGTITAGVGAGSAAVSGGGTTGVAAGGSGVVTLNKIATLVKAFVDGDGATGIQAKSATFTATDSSTITADAGAASLAIAGGGTTGVSLSIGVSIASNLISNEVEAFVKNANDSLTITTGLLSLTATTNATIKAVSVAASIAAGGGGTTGVTISGAGAAAINTILTKTNAYIKDSVVASAGAVTLAATNTATIDAKIAAVSVSAGGGGTAGVGVSIGAAVANNFIGYDGSTRQPAEVQAYIQNSSLTASGDLTLSAIANGTITAGVGAGSAAVSGGGTAGVAASGSGVSTENKIATLIKAFIDGDGASGIQAKSATLTANDSSTIKADAGAASLAASFGGTAGVSLSIGVALASNLISNEVAAFINNADNSFKTTTGGISLSATTSANIKAISVAASIAAGFGGTAGVAISGAGAAAINTILTKTNAYIKNSVVTSAGAVTLAATNSATIDATIAAVSVSASGGGTAGVGVSIGAAVGNNFIGYDNNGNRTPAEVQAYIQNSSLVAAGDLILTALSTSTINAGVGAGSAAISGGGTAGVAASGSGVSTENKIATLIKAFIDGDGATGIQAKSATLSAKDSSTIKADAGAASVAASFSGTASVSLSIGVALAHNVVTNEVEAYIQNADNFVKTTTGDVSLSATTDATINAVSVAASLSVGISGTAGIAVSGAGAESTNSISTKTNAYIKDSAIVSAEAVSVNAKNTAEISAEVVAASAAVGASGTAGVAASIGVAIARNFIGWDVDLTDTNYKYTTGSGEKSLNRGDRVVIKAGARAGDIYEFIGNPATINLQNADYSKASDWKQVNLKQNAAEVLAYVERSSINASRSLTLSSLSDATIEASVSSVSIAVAGGIGGASLSGAGVSTENKIATKIQAYIDGNGTTGISASSVSLTATDKSTISADAEAVSIGVTIAIGAAVSVGVSLAKNEIANDVRAFIQNVSKGLTATAGSIQLSTSETSIINATSKAASAAIGLVGIAGAGAAATNSISNAVKSYITNAVQVQAQGDVTLTSFDESTIQAFAGQVSAGTAAAVGVSVATNSISNQIIAEINEAEVIANGAIALNATSNSTIKSLSVGGVLAGLVGIAGATTLNTIANVIKAGIVNGSDVQSGGNINLTATENATIASLAGNVSVGIGGSIGASDATNILIGQVIAEIDKSQVTSTAGAVNLNATSTGTIQAIAAGGTGAGLFAAGGAVTLNVLGNIIRANIANGSNVQAQGNVSLIATNTTTIESLAGQVSIAGGAAIGASVAINNSASTTQAYISDSTVTSTGQAKAVAENASTIKSASAGASVALGAALTGSVSVNNITNTTDAHAKNANISAASGVEISAADKSTIESEAGQKSASAIAGVGAAVAYNNIGNTVTAYVTADDGKFTTIDTSGNAIVSAYSKDTINTIAAGGSAGLFVGAGASVAVNEMSNNVSASVQNNSSIKAKGSVGILADSDNTMITLGGTFSGGFVGLGGTIAVNNLKNTTRAYVNNSSVDGVGEQSITIPKTDETDQTESFQGVAVMATSKDTLNVTIGTGGAGGFAFVASVAVNSFQNTTEAYANDVAINAITGSTVQEQSTYIKAFNDSTVNVSAGTVGAGLAAAGVGIDITTMKNATAAYINSSDLINSQGSVVNANKDLIVEAKTQKSLTSNVVALGGGGISVQGAVSIINVSSGMSSDGLTAAGDTQSKVAQQLTDLNKMGKDSNGKSNIKTKSADFTTSPLNVQGTTAFIKGTASAGSNMIVNAYETTKLNMSVGSLSVGLLSVGGAVGIANIKHNASAYVGDRSRLVGGNITIKSTGFVNSTTVKAVAGSVGAIGLGAAVAYLSSENNSKAYIGKNTVVLRANNIDVIANSFSNLDAQGLGESYGLAAAGVVIANAKETGTTQAYTDSGVKEETGTPQTYKDSGVKIENTDNLNVKATAEETVTATTQASSGGIISGNGTDTKATVNPNVTAYIGDGSIIKVTKDINVLSNVSVDGDAASKGGSYGLLAVGLSFSEVNSNPTINTYVGADTTIEAGNISISSSLGKAPVTADTSFNPGNAVNNTADSITFTNNHGLRTGDKIVYSNGGGNDIYGLTNKASYTVIAVDDKTVKLGSEFNAASVDTKFNTLKFTNGHSFKNNQEVIYEAKSGTNNIGGLISGQKYYVKVIDGSTVQLSKTPVIDDVNEGAALSDITPESGATTIKARKDEDTDNVFKNGETVVYKKRSALFTVDEDKNIPDTDDDEPNIFNSSTGDIVSEDTINSASHGFETDDQVIYTATGSALGGLISGNKYYVIKEDDDKFQLSATKGGDAIDITSASAGTSHKITAVGLKTANLVNFTTTNSNQITVTNHGFVDKQAVEYTGTSSIGLTNGATYYVIKVDNNNFKLASTSGGAAVSLTAASDSHSLTAIGSELEEGVTYYVKNANSTSFQLSETLGGSAIALSNSGLTGTGANHIFVRQSVVDLTSTSTGIHNLHIDLENATATGTKHLLSSGASVVLPSQGDQVFSAYSQASAGGLIGGTGTETTLNITPNSNTYIGNNASLTATGNVTVKSLSNIQVTGATTSETFGAIAVGASKMNSTVETKNNTYIGSSAKIKAQGNVIINAQSDNNLNISASGGAGSLITFAKADAEAHLTHNTITTVYDNATIIANDDLVIGSSSNTNGNVKVTANGVGFYADADANGEFCINGTNRTDIKSNTHLEGRTLTVEAIVNNLNVEARSEAEGAGLIGNIDAYSKVDLAGTNATVNIGSGSYLKGDYINLNALYKRVTSNAIAFADCDGLGGDTDSDAHNIMPMSARVFTDATSILDVYKLNVKSALENVSYINDSQSDKAWELRIWTPFGDIIITMDFGTDTNNAPDFRGTSKIDFNSNVNFMARGANPVLEINADGVIVQQSDNVSYKFENNNVIVSDIKTTDYGEANFTGTLTDDGKYSIKDPAYDMVQIDNYSAKNLIINNIDAINLSASQFKHTANGFSENKSINGSLPVNSTLVTINNWSNSNLILQGVINNPHDRTILYSGGNIFSQGTAQNIITRDLTITALDSSIGVDGQRITAQLNQGYTPVTSDVTDSNIYLNVEAQNSIYLDLTAKSLDNQPATVNVKKMTANTGEVNLAIGQTTNQTNTSISALYKFTDAFNQSIIAGTNIVINAGTTTTNIDAQTLFLGTAGLLDVVTGGSINLKNVSGGVNLKQAISHQDAINLSGMNFVVVDDGVVQAGKDITLTVANLDILNNARLEAVTDVSLFVEDNLQLNSTATINAGNNVVIQGDYNNQDPTGTSITIDGWINAQNMYLYGDNNQDTFNIRRVGTTTYLYTGGDDDIVNIGSSQNRTDEIQKRLTIYGETQTDVDTLNVDNSGDTSNSIGVLTDTSLTGLGMGEGIYYNGFELLNINLGTGNDDFTILNTSATTNIDSNAGDDKFRIGAKVDASGNILDETVNGVLIPGINILGTSNITNIKAGAGNDYIQVNRNTAVLNIEGGIDNDIFEVNTPKNYSVLLTNAQVNLSGDDGNDKTIVNRSSLLETIQNNGSSVEVMNSRLINLMTNEIVVINGNTGTTGSSGGSSNIDAILSSLSDRTVVNSNNGNTNNGNNPILSSLSDRTVVNSSGATGVMNPLLLALFSR